MNEKSYTNVLIYNFSYKNLIIAKTFRIIFDKVDGFIRDYDVRKYVVLFVPEKYNVTFDRIRYLIGLSSDITIVFFFKIRQKLFLDDDFPLEKNIDYV